MSNMIKVSDYIIKRLEELEVRHMFMLPGGGAMHLNDSLGKSTKIKHIVCLHEQAASMAAEAYARVNNKIGLLMVTTGPGGTNALTGVAGAYLESTPMFVVSGQVKTLDMINQPGQRQQGMQELDIISVVKNITKYSAVVKDPYSIKVHMDKALFYAMHGRKGPVWLDIPLDIQATMIDEDKLISEDESTFTLPKLDDDVEEKALKYIELLNASKKPVILAGNGIRLSDAIDDFQRLIEVLDIPVLTTWNGIDLLEEENKYYFGRPGGLGHRYANFIQQNSDLFLSLGARLNLLQTGYNFDGFAKKAIKIMVDIDRAELNKINVRPDIKVCADVKDFIKYLLKHKDKIKKVDRSDWFTYADNMKKKYPIIKNEYLENNDKVNTYLLIETISKYMKNDQIYVSGSSGSSIDISMQGFKVKKGQRAFSTKGLASMGYGLPSTIGAALASGKKVVSMQGDGGFIMNIQELETIRRLNLPIKIFVLCNGGYGAIKATQTNIFNKNYVGCDEGSGLTIPDIKKVAEAFSIKTVEIKDNNELDTKVKEVLSDDTPTIVKCITPITLTALPKQVSRKNAEGQMESLTLEYMHPMLSDEEMSENMNI